MYNHLIYLENDNDISLELLEVLIQSFYQGKLGAPTAIEQKGNTLVVFFGDYNFKFNINKDATIQEELKELVADSEIDAAGNLISLEEFGNSPMRIEMSGAEDWDMDYLNDSLLIIQAIESHYKIAVFMAE